MSKPIKLSALFRRNFKRRVVARKKIRILFNAKLMLFKQNPDHPELQAHSLKGKMSHLKAFRINDDWRVIYLENENRVLFVDIGRHKEVY